jgi:hypothetical protein
MSEEYRKEILTNALTSRQKEVVEYQINIDNFKLAIDLAAQDPDMVDFKKQLEDLLRSNIIEQKKSKILLQVIQQQLENDDVLR